MLCLCLYNMLSRDIRGQIKHMGEPQHCKKMTRRCIQMLEGYLWSCSRPAENTAWRHQNDICIRQIPLDRPGRPTFVSWSHALDMIIVGTLYCTYITSWLGSTAAMTSQRGFMRDDVVNFRSAAHTHRV